MTSQAEKDARMPNTQLSFVPCLIERGGFSSERTFEISISGRTLIGTAYVEYLRDSHGRRIDENVPSFGESIPGLVQCRVIRDLDSQMVQIEVPSTDVMALPKEMLASI